MVQNIHYLVLALNIWDITSYCFKTIWQQCARKYQLANFLHLFPEIIILMTKSGFYQPLNRYNKPISSPLHSIIYLVQNQNNLNLKTLKRRPNQTKCFNYLNVRSYKAKTMKPGVNFLYIDVVELHCAKVFG